MLGNVCNGGLVIFLGVSNGVPLKSFLVNQETLQYGVSILGQNKIASYFSLDIFAFLGYNKIASNICLRR